MPIQRAPGISSSSTTSSTFSAACLSCVLTAQSLCDLITTKQRVTLLFSAAPLLRQSVLYTRLHGQALRTRSCASACASPASATDPLPLRGSCLLPPARQCPSIARSRPGSAGQRLEPPGTLRRLSNHQLRSSSAHDAPAWPQLQARPHLPSLLCGPPVPATHTLMRTTPHNRHATVRMTHGAGHGPPVPTTCYW